MNHEVIKNIFSHNYERYLKLNPEADFDTFSTSALSLWRDQSSTGHPNDLVDKITAKTLLIRGDNDFMTSLKSLCELQNHIEGASLLNVPFAEHVVYEEQPEIVKQIILRFLSEN